MSDLEIRFDAAVEASTELDQRPDNDTLLALYGLYKQAREGDVQADRPSSVDFVVAAKFDAWEALEGVSREDAMAQYVALIDSLKA